MLFFSVYSIVFPIFKLICSREASKVLTPVCFFLKLEDDILANKMYLTKITDFVHSITSNNWLYIEFSVLGFIGKQWIYFCGVNLVHNNLKVFKNLPKRLLLNRKEWHNFYKDTISLAEKLDQGSEFQKMCF